jgi:hypothetical protein
VKTGILPLDRIQAMGDPTHFFFNLNSPGDLIEANILWQEDPSR